MSSPPDLPPPKAQDTEPGVLSPTPSASQPRHDVPKRLIDMCIEPRNIVYNFKFTPPFDAVEVGKTIQFGCYPKRELKEWDYSHQNGPTILMLFDVPCYLLPTHFMCDLRLRVDGDDRPYSSVHTSGNVNYTRNAEGKRKENCIGNVTLIEQHTGPSGTKRLAAVWTKKRLEQRGSANMGGEPGLQHFFQVDLWYKRRQGGGLFLQVCGRMFTLTALGARPGSEDGGRNSPIQTANRALDLVRSPDAMHWYIFANSNVVWDITTDPVSHREYPTSESEVMPFGPANSAALTSDYQKPLVPQYATAVPESPPDPTNDPYARAWRKPAVREMVEPWKDKVAQTAENVDPDKILLSPPSVYQKSPASSRRSSTLEVPASNVEYLKENTEIKPLSQITVEEKELNTEDVELESQSGDEVMHIDADNASDSGGSPMDLGEEAS